MRLLSELNETTTNGGVVSRAIISIDRSISIIDVQVENRRERGEARDKAERVSHARSLRGALLKSNHVTRRDVYLSSLAVKSSNR